MKLPSLESPLVGGEATVGAPTCDEDCLVCLVTVDAGGASYLCLRFHC